MGMRAHIHPVSGRHVSRAEMVKEHERPDIASVRERQQAADEKAAQVTLAGFNNQIDSARHGNLSVSMRISMDEAAQIGKQSG